MASRLRSLKSKLRPIPQRVAPSATPSSNRIAGRELQRIRWRLWTANPHCVDCARLTHYPDGFEVDHDVALELGGKDTAENRRLRCPECHAAKTRQDNAAARAART